MSTCIVYLDIETTGLDPDIHQVWEIALAIDDGPIRSSIVSHSIYLADESALEVSGYTDRDGPTGALHNRRTFRGRLYEYDTFEQTVYDALHGVTIVGANPAFDAAFLRARWGSAPWHYRLLDVEAYAMGALGHDRPQSLNTITRDLRARGFDIPVPDHTAAADVATTRACHLALTSIYARMGGA